MIEVLLGITKLLQSCILSLILGFYFFNYFIKKQLKSNSRINRYVIIALILTLIVSLFDFFSQSFYRYEDILKTFDINHIKIILFNTRFGNIWLLDVLIIFIILSLIAVNKPNNLLFIFLLSLSLGLGSLTGHSISSENIFISIPSNFLHIVSISLWIGSLPFLYISVLSKTNLNYIRRYSFFASYNMILIVATGMILSLLNLDYSFAVLLGTPYGNIIILKLCFVILALASALYVRLVFLNRKYIFNIKLSLKNILRIEISSALFVFVLGILLSQTIPGAHEEIKWPLSFRISIDVAMENPINQNAILVLSIGMSLLLGIVLMDYILNKNLKRIYNYYIPMAIFSAAGLVYFLSIEAYPVTYKQSSVPYSAISVYNGKMLYRNNCVSCHGYSGHGDGVIVSNELAIMPANLTEPHTAYHTAGDIYWWLTYGMPPSIMPGFKESLNEDERWDLINYLRALSSGYEARILSEEIIHKKPWLAAIDFDYVTRSGMVGRLSQFRGNKTVILVLVNNINKYEQRINKLIDTYKDFKKINVEILLVPDYNLFNNNSFIKIMERIPFPIIYEGSEEIIQTYNLFRRTLLNPDKEDIKEREEYMEFIIDKFGYVRSRWKKEEIIDQGRSFDYKLMIKILNEEGKILDFPDEHVH